MKTPDIEYGPETRYGHERFGRGSHSFINSQLVLISEEAVRDEALRLGWSNGCPVARELTSPNSPYGLEWMLYRYSETNQWFKWAVYTARSNRALYNYLSSPRLRLNSEPVGKHEPLSVPKSHLWRISPASGIDGYAASRITIEIRKSYGELTDTGIQKAFDALDSISKAVGNQPGRYLALLSEEAVKHGVEPVRILSHAYAREILEEENTQVTYHGLAQTFESDAPTIWKAYLSLSEAEKAEHGIAEIPILHFPVK